MAYNNHIAEADLELWRRRGPCAEYWLNVLPNHPEINAPIHIPNNQGLPVMYPNAPGLCHPWLLSRRPPVFDARHAPPQVPAARTGVI